jgi:hypothetical protein
MKLLGAAPMVFGFFATLVAGVALTGLVATGIGLLGLVAGLAQPKRRCLYCGGFIRRRAKTCRHCRSRLAA